jgi:hypothetical protein
MEAMATAPGEPLCCPRPSYPLAGASPAIESVRSAPRCLYVSDTVILLGFSLEGYGSRERSLGNSGTVADSLECERRR